jgi:hypothetical protein
MSSIRLFSCPHQIVCLDEPVFFVSSCVLCSVHHPCSDHTNIISWKIEYETLHYEIVSDPLLGILEGPYLSREQPVFIKIMVILVVIACRSFLDLFWPFEIVSIRIYTSLRPLKIKAAGSSETSVFVFLLYFNLLTDYI